MSKSQQQLQQQSRHTKYIHNRNLSHTNPVPNNNNHNRSRSRKFVAHTDPLPLFARARELYQIGQLKEALMYYEEGIRVCGDGDARLGDAMYYAGQLCMALGDYPKAQSYLRKSITTPKETNLLLLSICLTKQSKHEFQYLDKLCDELKSVDGIFYRGKLRLKNMQYGDAARDFGMLVEEMGAGGLAGRIWLAEARYWVVISGQGKEQANKEEVFKGMVSNVDGILCQLYKNQSQVSSKSKQINDSIRKCRNLKAQILLQLNRLQQAQKQIDLNLGLKQPQPSCLPITPKRDSQTLFLKSLVYKKTHNSDKQTLLLNECITVKDHRRSVTLALQTLVIQAMKQKDFYQAFEYSKRNNYLKIENKATVCLCKIAEAITFEMKKKYGEALLLIGAIDVGVYSGLGAEAGYIRNLHYSALGYAYFSLGEHKDALAMYKKIQIIESDSQHLAYLYNRKLCQGILTYKQHHIEQSIKIFQSSTDHLMRAQPYFYISVILIQKNLSTNPDPSLITKVVQIIDSGLKVSENYQMYYYRALLYFYLGMNAEALEDVDRAVEKSEENVARFFYLRALVFWQERNLENAVSELTTCLSIDEKFYEAYLERAKIRLLSDQVEEAYEDLSKYPLQEQWRPLFLLYQHQYQTIIEQNLGDQHTKQTSNFHLGNFANSGPPGKLLLAIQSQSYSQVTALLDDALQINFQIGCLSTDDIYMLKSYCLYKMGEYKEAVKMLEKAEEMLKRSQNGGDGYGYGVGEEEEKKLLAIKVDGIYCWVAMGEFGVAYQLCLGLINDVYEGNVYDQLNKVKQHVQKLINISKNPQSQYSQPPLSTIELFPNSPMLSNHLPAQTLQNLTFNFLLCYPKVRVPELQHVPCEQPLIDFTIAQIDNRAEAPWMNKDENGVIFTNKIQVFENLRLYTETERAEGEGSEVEGSKVGSKAGVGSKSKFRGKTSKERLKEELMLDAEVLSKLEKLSKNKKIKSSDKV